MITQNFEEQREENREEVIALIALLRDGSMDHPVRGEFPVRRQAVYRLVALGSVAVEPLCHALRDQDGYTRRFAAEALARLGDPRAVVPLIIAFEESEVYVQRHMAEALAIVGDVRAIAPLYGALSNPAIAREALYALRAVLERTARAVASDDLRRVASLGDVGRAVVETPDTDGGYLSWEQVEQWLDCRPVKELAQQELKRRGLTV